MLTIDKIKSNLPPDTMRFELFLSDYCNYQCWYCSDEFHSKTVQWPSLDPLLSNFLHLLDYYKSAGKKKFIIHIGGGEPTLWPNLVDFVKAVKEHSNCIVSLTSNGSRTLRWWEENSQHFDHISISVHHERADPEHIAQVGDIIYKSKVPLWSSVLMDPKEWDKCMGIIKTLKSSKYKWSISATQIHHHTINYSEEQKKFLENKSCRGNSIYYEFFINRRVPRYPKPTIFYQGAKKKVSEHWLLLNGYNNFKGWLCNVGVDTAFINRDGNLKGSCGNTLYGKDFYFNIFDSKFKEVFHPDIKPVICEMNTCICQPEVNCNKENVKGHKIIKILKE